MESPKVYTVYLPQFYETEHNSKWWGEGFTDWTTVREAEALFDKHEQPKIPLNNNYYDLLNKTTMEWQANIAKQYGVDGFSFYHYYFGEGRMELEKPAENLLAWRDIDMPFYFCWANESWVRTWSKFTGNVWAEEYDSEHEDANDDGVLVEQKYGEESEWTRHFYYLLPFFQDERYIQVDGMPVFCITSPDNISCLKDMIQLWRELAQKEGLNGIYIIGQESMNYTSVLDAIQLCDTPMQYRRKKPEKARLQGGVYCVEYQDFLNDSLKKSSFADIKTFFQCMVGYDTTPRRGRSGDCIVERTPELFKNFLVKLLQKSIYYNNEFVVINAWNEWGEGMHLEPDEQDKYGYLQAVSDAKGIVDNMSEDECITEVKKFINIEDNKVKDEYIKFRTLCGVYSKWLQKEIEREYVFSEKLAKEEVSKVAIYGMGDLGRKLSRSLLRENIEVVYGIDMYVARDRAGVDVYRPEEEWPITEAIIITAYDKGEIKEMLLNKIDCKIYYLQDFFD